MKVIVQFSNAVLREVGRLTARARVGLRALLERRPYRVIAEKKHDAPFKLRPASFKGNGLQTGLERTPWARLRDLIYEVRVP